MANKEQVDRLHWQGVADWNQWRKEHPEIRPDLSGADLSNVEIPGATFLEAALTRICRFNNANFREADLSGANLNGASLKGADLSGANLRGASLKGTNL